jgi:alpha-D-ribose 1-methylphosphonate 5-triphosphate synthase subunit PhnG
MTRKRRTRILILGDANVRKKYASIIGNKYAIQEIETPNNGLVMMKMREGGRNGLFYLGELLVTEAKVTIDGVFGLGIVSGDESDTAKELAVIDAAFNAGFSETKEWEAELLALEAVIEKRESDEDSDIARTRVSFETMDA